jgi:GNAT superfamily N-acetyltransferase
LSHSKSKKYIEKLNSSHNLTNFDCQTEELNQFLIKFSLQNQQGNSANTYVACDDNRVIGFYSLSVGSVIHADSPKRISKGLAKHPIPVMILTRLAVDHKYMRQGLGKGLLKDALLRTVSASEIAGIRALLVHAKDKNAKNWYQQFGFEASPTDHLHLYLLMKDIKKNYSITYIFQSMTEKIVYMNGYSAYAKNDIKKRSSHESVTNKEHE